jgi:NAD-dependent dihydropyrimidine dehydrogenase PreA subunit
MFKNASPQSKLTDLKFSPQLCDFCGCCVAVCPADCIELEEMRLAVDMRACILCGNCPKACPTAALTGVTA